MAKEKYTIFISSTFEDLRDERDQIIKAILEMGHIPVGMEMFSAGDEQQWELIKRTIDESDYYIVVVAHRYGSLDGSISFTEKEYDYAISESIPALGFIIDDSAKWPKNKMDTDTVKVELLNKFKAKVRNKIVNFWQSKDELNAKVTVALSKAITVYPRTGWLKAESAIGVDTFSELTRLSKENAELRKNLSKAIENTNAQKREEESRIIDMLNANNARISFYYQNSNGYTNKTKFSYMNLFFLIAPELMIEATINRIALLIGVLRNPEKENPDKILRDLWPIPSNILRNILADFQALNLIYPSPKKHLISDTEQYWCLSEKGVKVYSQIRISKLEAGIAAPEETNTLS